MGDEVVEGGAHEGDGVSVRQLLHAHNQLLNEKKEMEQYFDDVDREVAQPARNAKQSACPPPSGGPTPRAPQTRQKSSEITSLKDKLNQMKRELEVRRPPAGLPPVAVRRRMRRRRTRSGGPRMTTRRGRWRRSARRSWR